MGSIKILYRRIAELAARGYSAEQIAREVNRSVMRVRMILDKPEIYEEIKNIVKERFEEGDRLLSYLYKKALKELDVALDSDNFEIKDRAIEKVLKMMGYGKTPEGGVRVFQFFGQGSNKGFIESIDDLILQKRKERGLLEYDNIESKEEKVIDVDIEDGGEKNESM